ncbi:Hypothetical protein, putative [Bodo saltans]|uniref:Uncharacterized protein n=1 Tax=Bodo saltans TaxID=75058 RepID=A0A0S4JDV6_BODSA|nr:Hypothetical protein, putative [Bodo saltans]|eukprot:CUG88339.1 Hypothetical protein, putative [Bodo saltans]
MLTSAPPTQLLEPQRFASRNESPADDTDPQHANNLFRNNKRSATPTHNGDRGDVGASSPLSRSPRELVSRAASHTQVVTPATSQQHRNSKSQATTYHRSLPEDLLQPAHVPLHDDLDDAPHIHHHHHSTDDTTATTTTTDHHHHATPSDQILFPVHHRHLTPREQQQQSTAGSIASATANNGASQRQHQQQRPVAKSPVSVGRSSNVQHQQRGKEGNPLHDRGGPRSPGSANMSQTSPSRSSSQPNPYHYHHPPSRGHTPPLVPPSAIIAHRRIASGVDLVVDDDDDEDDNNTTFYASRNFDDDDDDAADDRHFQLPSPPPPPHLSSGDHHKQHRSGPATSSRGSSQQPLRPTAIPQPRNATSDVQQYRQEQLQQQQRPLLPSDAAKLAARRASWFRQQQQQQQQQQFNTPSSLDAVAVIPGPHPSHKHTGGGSVQPKYRSDHRVVEQVDWATKQAEARRILVGGSPLVARPQQQQLQYVTSARQSSPRQGTTMSHVSISRSPIREVSPAATTDQLRHQHQSNRAVTPHHATRQRSRYSEHQNHQQQHLGNRPTNPTASAASIRRGNSSSCLQHRTPAAVATANHVNKTAPTTGCRGKSNSTTSKMSAAVMPPSVKSISTSSPAVPVPTPSSGAALVLSPSTADVSDDWMSWPQQSQFHCEYEDPLFPKKHSHASTTKNSHLAKAGAQTKKRGGERPSSSRTSYEDKNNNSLDHSVRSSSSVRSGSVSKRRTTPAAGPFRDIPFSTDFEQQRNDAEHRRAMALAYSDRNRVNASRWQDRSDVRLSGGGHNNNNNKSISTIGGGDSEGGIGGGDDSTTNILHQHHHHRHALTAQQPAYPTSSKLHQHHHDPSNTLGGPLDATTKSGTVGNNSSYHRSNSFSERPYSLPQQQQQQRDEANSLQGLNASWNVQRRFSSSFTHGF